MKRKILLLVALSVFCVPADVLGEDHGQKRYVVDDSRIEEDRQNYKPLLERMPVLSIGSSAPRYSDELERSRNWVRLSDYPIAAWNGGRTGRAEARLYIGEDGRLLRCAIMVSSGHEDLDRATCAPFGEPATYSTDLEAERPSVVDTHDFAFDWEKKLPEFPDSVTVSSRAIIDTQGLPHSCEILEVTGPIPDRMRRRLEIDPCGWASPRTIAPYRDAEGRPVQKVVTMQYTISVEDLPESSSESE